MHPQIRNICITDCTCDSDYGKIRVICGDYTDEEHKFSLLSKPPTIIGSIGNYLLYDNGDAFAFMYFWSADKNLSNCTRMTVQEFYQKYAPEYAKPTEISPYEYW